MSWANVQYSYSTTDKTKHHEGPTTGFRGDPYEGSAVLVAL